MLAVEMTPARLTRDYAAFFGAALTGLAMIAVVLLREPGTYESLVLLAFSGVSALIVATDIRTLRAPNAIVYPSVVAALGLAVPLGVSAVAQALGGGLVAFLVLLLVALAGRGAMGLGDVKAGALCGTVVGISGIPLLLLSAFVGGGVFAAIALALRVRGRKDVVAFTPFLVTGALVALALGDGYLVQ